MNVALMEVLAVGWALGMAVFTSTLFVFYLVGVPFHLSVLLALVIVVILAGVGLRVVMQSRASPVTSLANLGWVKGTLGLLVCGGSLLLSVWTAERTPFNYGWDSWAIWALKAKFFYEGGPPASYFHDRLLLFSHPNYPLNLPLAEAPLLSMSGSKGPFLAALLGPVCLAALLVIVFVGTSREYGQGVALLCTSALALLPEFPILAGRDYADVPLAMYLCGATLYLLLWLETDQTVNVALMGMFAGGAAWTKKEGLAASAVFLVIVAVCEVSRHRAETRKRIRNLSVGIVSTLAIPAPWIVFSVFVHPIGEDVLPLSPHTALANVSRVPTIASYFLRQMANTDNWSGLWFLLGIGLLCLGPKLSVRSIILIAILLAELVVDMGAYVYSDWHPYIYHIQVSVDRLFAQIAPIGLLLLIDVMFGSDWDRSLAARMAGALYQRRRTSGSEHLEDMPSA